MFTISIGSLRLHIDVNSTMSLKRIVTLSNLSASTICPAMRLSATEMGSISRRRPAILCFSSSSDFCTDWSSRINSSR
ncbi:hypothetical protein GBAR_LOCUS31499 [Geodia barretti]|uniref:Uncharacterized protein n=1 Tax=Geodia barretti TaxID=519541 RepID=A0AA35U3A2_GEOBA|nr:hypothetical protein GBAR_LOCUS31499 [Geodia barretti]